MILFYVNYLHAWITLVFNFSVSALNNIQWPTKCVTQAKFSSVRKQSNLFQSFVLLVFPLRKSYGKVSKHTLGNVLLEMYFVHIFVRTWRRAQYVWRRCLCYVPIMYQFETVRAIKYWNIFNVDWNCVTLASSPGTFAWTNQKNGISSQTNIDISVSAPPTAPSVLCRPAGNLSRGSGDQGSCSHRDEILWNKII